MNKKFIISLFIFISFLSCQNYEALENSVTFNINPDRKNYYSGENLYLNISLNINKGYHIYSVHPDKSLSPTYIEILDSTYFSNIGIMLEPKPKKKCDESFNQFISYHDNKTTFSLPLRVDKNVLPGKYKVNALLNYLACDKSMCIPKADPFSFDLIINDGNARLNYTKDFDTKFNFLDIESCEDVSDLDEEINKGIFSFILFSIGMGLLALLTPCVFPMIPITVSYFTKEGEKKNSYPLKSASIYALGIVIIFSSLGIILALTLGATGARDLAQNPWVNLFIAILFIYFAFSLFGYYEIQVPSILRQYSLKQESKGGTLGILFMSLTFTLTSFTCTVQFVGLLLVAASSGEYFWPILGMICFSSAFAFPFFYGYLGLCRGK